MHRDQKVPARCYGHHVTFQQAQAGGGHRGPPFNTLWAPRDHPCPPALSPLPGQGARPAPGEPSGWHVQGRGHPVPRPGHHIRRAVTAGWLHTALPAPPSSTGRAAPCWQTPDREEMEMHRVPAAAETPAPLQLSPAASPSNTVTQEPKSISYKLITKPPVCRGGSQPSPTLLPRVPAGSFN